MAKANKLRECLIVWEERPGSGRWHVLSFDGVISEGLSGESIVTSYPVDSGFMVSDHTIRQNRLIRLDTITSNFSMSVATSRKTFKESFNELMTVISAGAQNNNLGYGYSDSIQASLPPYLNEGGTNSTLYDQATKHGRADYDNDKIDLSVPYLNIPLVTLTDPVSTALLAQVSMDKVDDTVAVINELNALGVLVHCVTMRGVWPNCVIRAFDTRSDVTTAYAAPVSIVLEQLNVIDQSRSAVPTFTRNSTGTEAAQSTANMRNTQQSANTFQNFMQRGTPQVGAMAFAVTALTPFVAPKPVVRIAPTPVNTIPPEFYQLSHKEIPYSTQYDTQFSYAGRDYLLGRVRYNEALQCYTTSLRWKEGNEYLQIDSISLQSGTNLLRQYSIDLPSLVAINIDDREVDPTSNTNLRLFIIVDYDKYFLGGV